MEKILIIDDDVQLSKLIEEFLETFNYEITIIHEPEPALEFLKKNEMDLIILDIMLPGIDGFQALRKIREDSQIPVIMLTARGEVTDRIVGLELGADDYLAKPFEPKELLLRIKNIIMKNKKIDLNKTNKIGEAKIDLNKMFILLKDKKSKINNSEKKVLLEMLSNPGKTYTRAQIGEISNITQERSIDVMITRLRQKIETNPKSPKYLQTIRGSGYVLWIE
jgi:two-component system phosphate regulon response regulator OmpR